MDPEHKYKSEEELEEVNKEIEAYLLKKLENPDDPSLDETLDEEKKDSFSVSGFLFSSMTIILVIIALVRVGHLILQWVQRIF